MKRDTVRKLLLRLLFYVSVPPLLLVVFGWGCADAIIFQPPRPEMMPTRDMVMLESSDGRRTACLYLPLSGAEYTILYSHGNAEDLFDLGYHLERFREHGYAVAAYDYQGYGASGGKAGEAGCKEDIERVYAYLTGKLGIAPERIVIYGRSVGGGPSCYLASRRRAAALVLESPFTSAYRVMLPFTLPGDRFRNLELMSGICMPVLIIHGDKDEVINVSHGRRLFAAAGEPKHLWIVPGAGHNDLTEVAGRRYWDELSAFLSSIGAAGKRRDSTLK